MCPTANQSTGTQSAGKTNKKINACNVKWKEMEKTEKGGEGKIRRGWTDEIRAEGEQ